MVRVRWVVVWRGSRSSERGGDGRGYGAGMSIWISVGEEGGGVSDLLALYNDGDAANYRGEGTPHVHVDVMVTGGGFHDLTRLALYADTEPAVDTDVLLTRDAVRRLRDRLTRALGEAP